MKGNKKPGFPYALMIGCFWGFEIDFFFSLETLYIGMVKIKMPCPKHVDIFFN